MENIGLLSSTIKDYEYGYGLAYKLACEQLAKTNDIKQQCLRSGAKYIAAERAIVVQYLNQPFQIALPDVEISVKDSPEAVPLKDRILVLHYLTQAKGTPRANKLITFKEFSDGANYFPTFHKRAIKPLVDNFGSEPERLLPVAEGLGARRADYGDIAVTIDAFPQVPLTLVLWRGDDEFPPEGNIIFDSNVSDYLTTEDINILCETVAWKLVRSLRAGGDKNSRRS